MKKNDMFKRVADWLEKISAGSMLVGLFQTNFYAITIGLLTFGAILGLQIYLQRREKWNI